MLPQGHDRIALWGVLLVLLITGLLFLWSRAHYHQGVDTVATEVDGAGHLHILGITLGVTTLRQAESALQSKSDVALYIYPQEHPKAGLKLEAFFPAIADHTKVILLLDQNIHQLQEIERRATTPHLYENGVARMNLAAMDVRRAYDMVVRELTLIPNLTISPATLKGRFGEPSSMRPIDESSAVYQYDDIALTAVISEMDSPVLHFVNPSPR
ncbi:MAG: hypothetical protein Q9M13_07175 [Mariprofundales bacterium]|nr:hypothetical protein [Mariprofundales bacterium]